MKGRILNLALVLVLATLLMTANDGQSEAQQIVDQPAQIALMPAPDEDSQGSPIMFIENVGQWEEGARFQVWGGPAGTVWLAQDAIWITVMEPGEPSGQENWEPSRRDKGFDPAARFEDREDPAPRRGVNIKLSFVGAHPAPLIESFDRLDTTVSYFLGDDSGQWRSDVPVWGGVRYVDLYPGIDLEFTGEGGRLAPRVAAAAGADLSALQLRVEGAEAVAVEGALLRLSAAGRVSAWPLFQAEGVMGEAAVQPRGAENFDVSLPLVVQAPALSVQSAMPVAPADNPAALLYGSFLGGDDADYGGAIAVDRGGSAYVTGATTSSDFPSTPGAFATSYGGNYTEAFVAKLTPTGSGLIYATFLGGYDIDGGSAIAVDDAGNAYVAGYTYSNDFPTTPGAFDTDFNGIWDAFVTKLNPDGSGLVYATLLGGISGDDSSAIAVDGGGSVYVTGYTGSSNFPTTPDVFDSSLTGSSDAFVAKLTPDGGALAYATFLGGNGRDVGHGIIVNGAGSAYMTGRTSSSDFPVTPGAFDESFNGGDYDAFVATLNRTGSGLVYATFVGGNGSDEGHTIVVDGAGRAYVAGKTASSNFPTTPNAFDGSFNGGNDDAFVARLNRTGSGLAFATFLGGSSSDEVHDIVVNGAGSAFVTGATNSSDFPTTPDAFDRRLDGYSDAFVVKLGPAGRRLTYATFLGGSDGDSGSAIALDRRDNVHVAGSTDSSDFPTTPDAFDTSHNGYWDVFAAKLAAGDRVTPSQYLPLISCCAQ